MTAHTPAKDIAPVLQRSVRHAFGPLQREFNRFFDEMGDGFAAFAEPAFAPRMDVVETKDGLQVTVEVPGLAGDEVKVTAQDDILTIRGEKSDSREKAEGAAHLTERRFGRFSRALYLPRSADPAKIAATLKDGLLKIEIPRRADAETKTIEIRSK